MQTPHGRFHLREHVHRLADIIERGVGVRVERQAVNYAHPEREIIVLCKNTSRDRNCFAQQCLGFCVALEFNKGYATAISVLLTGVLSMVLFGTELSVEYALGMTNVLAAVFLYNAQDLEKHAW